MIIKVTDIVWDTEGEVVGSLPEAVTIEAHISEDAVSDYLSDVYGWCVKNYVVTGLTPMV